MLAAASAADRERSLLLEEKPARLGRGSDMASDLDGRYVTTFVRRKITMRSGETERAETVANPALEAVGERIARHLKPVGNLDCDLIVSPKGIAVLDMNARFGGGYPFSHVAGANLPAALLAWANQETPAPEWLRVTPGIRSIKCDRLVVTLARQELRPTGD